MTRQPVDARDYRRDLNAEILRFEAHRKPVHGARDVHLTYRGQPLSVRVYNLDAPGLLPLLLYVHGAGWVAGNLDTHDNVCRHVAARVPAVVVSVDYRLAPEHKFPIALEDTYHALCWMAENLPALNVDVARLAVAGDSAGANLAAAVCLLARDSGGPEIGFQLLVNPALDFSAYDAPGFEEMKWFRGQYLSDITDVGDPYASPLLAPDLSGLPPAFVITGELDCLRAEGEAYVRRLQEAGVQADVHRQAGTGHLGPQFARATQEAAAALDLSVAALKSALLGRLDR